MLQRVSCDATPRKQQATQVYPPYPVSLATLPKTNLRHLPCPSPIIFVLVREYPSIVLDLFHLFPPTPTCHCPLSLSSLKFTHQVFLSPFAPVFPLSYFHSTPATPLLIPTHLILTPRRTPLCVPFIPGNPIPHLLDFFTSLLSTSRNYPIAYNSPRQLSFIPDYSASHISKISNPVSSCHSPRHSQPPLPNH